MRIVEAFTGHLIDWLHRGEIDLAVLPGPGADLHLRSIGLLYENYALVGPRDCSLSPAVPVAISELASLDLILSSTGHGMRTFLETAARRAHVKLKTLIEVDSARLMMSLVEAGIGYTVGPVSFILPEIESGRVRVAPLERPTITRQLILALPSGRPDTRATTVVKELLLKETADLIKCGVWKATADDELFRALDEL